MSVQKRIARLTVPQLMARKGQEPIVCLTSYHAHTASLIDPHVDLLLVGDSLGMVMYGMENTAGRDAGHDDCAWGRRCARF
jgi:3-methyl-2-oxobutanoate hydroxymethyltransferase